LAAAAVVATSTACLAALVAVVVEHPRPKVISLDPAGLELLAKVTLAAMARTLLPTIPVTAAAVVVLGGLVQMPFLVPVAVVLAVRVSVTQSVQVLHRTMVAVVVALPLRAETPLVALAAAVEAQTVVLRQHLGPQIPVAVAVEQRLSGGTTAALAAPVSW
jgi:hypothetical protein